MVKKINYKALATDIYNWCAEREIWEDACIYFNGKAWTTNEEWNGEYGKEIGEGLYEYENKNPKDYCEYCNPDTLSMTFEGSLYEVLNYYWSDGYYMALFDSFNELFDKYDVYFEPGHAWSLTTVID